MAPSQQQPNFWDFIKRFDQGNSRGAQPNAPFNPFAAATPGPETGDARPAPPPPPYGTGFPFDARPGDPHPFANGFQWSADPRAFWAAAHGRPHHGRGRHGDHGRHGGNDNNERARSPSQARSQIEGMTNEKRDDTEKDKGKEKENVDANMGDHNAWRAHWRPDGDWSRDRDWGRGWGGWGRWDERSRSRSRSPHGEHTESSEESGRDRRGRGRREHGRRRHGQHGRGHAFPGRGGFGGGFTACGPWGTASCGAPGGRDGERAFRRWGRHGARGFGAGPSGNSANGAFDMKAMFDSISQHPVAQVFRNFMENQQQQNPATGERLAPEDAHEDDDNTFVPAVDIFATEQAYILHVSLPGAKKEDIGVNWDAEKQILRLAGVVYRQGDEQFLQTLVPGRNERRVGVFDRTVRLPPITVTTTNAADASEGRKEEIDGDGITAKLEDGVLVITVPKIEREDAFVEVKKIDIA